MEKAIKQIAFPEEIVDIEIKKKCEEAINNKKIPLFLLEEKEYIPDTYTPISLNLKGKEYKPQSFSYSYDTVDIFYDDKKGCAYAISKPITKKAIMNIIMSIQGKAEPRTVVILDDKIYLTGRYRTYDLKNETTIEISPTIDFKIYPPTIDDIIPLLLITQEYKKYAIIPCYLDERLIRTLLL